MTTYAPLVIVSGKVQQLQSGDTLQGGAVPTVVTSAGPGSSGNIPALNSAGKIDATMTHVGLVVALPFAYP